MIMDRKQLQHELAELRYERTRRASRGFSTRRIDAELARIERELRSVLA